MRNRASTAVAWGICLLAVPVGLVGIALELTFPSSISRGGDAAAAVQVAALLPAILALPVIGALVASRRPSHPVGWLFLAAGLALSACNLAVAYAWYGLVEVTGSVPGALYALWASPRLLRWGIALALLAYLLFPTGRLPSRRWRVAPVLVIASTALNDLGRAFEGGPLVEDYPPNVDVSNPLVIASAQTALDAMVTVGGWLSLLAFLSVASVLVVRFRRSSALERQQLKWLVYAAGLMVGCFFAAAVVQEWIGEGDRSTSTLGIFGVLGFGMVSVAAGVAILRYHLFDIDLIINRTLVYGTLTALVAGLYSALVSLFVSVFRDTFSQPSIPAIVLVTLAVAAAFTPVKSRLQSLVDSIYPAERDPAKELTGFRQQVEMLRQVVNVEQLNGEGLLRRLLSEATAAYGAEGGAVYLGQGERRKLFHTMGEWEGEPALSVPLIWQGQENGSVALGRRCSRAPYTRDDELILRQVVDVVAPLIRTRSAVPTRPTRRSGLRAEKRPEPPSVAL